MSRKHQDPARAAQDVLKDMLANPRRGVRNWRVAATALASDYEAPEAWRTFRSVDEDLVLSVVNLVRQALDATARELNRPREEQAERDALARVRRLAIELNEAIRASSLPGNWLQGEAFVARGDKGAELPLEIGWHSLSIDPFIADGAVTVCQVLDWAVGAVDRHVERLPMRAARRRHDRTAHVQVFVRYLAWYFGREFGTEKHTTIAHIASSIFKIDGVDGKPAVLDAKQVEGLLKGRPAPFTPRKDKRAVTT